MSKLTKFRFWDRKAQKMVDWMTLMQTAFNRGDSPLLYSVFVRDRMDGELLQYIGLKDKNRSEIYVGGVLKVSDPDRKHQIQEVRFKDGCFCGFSENKPCQYTTIDVLIRAKGVEVIGNIYENPGLLGLPDAT